MRAAATYLILLYGAAHAQNSTAPSFDRLSRQADDAREHDRLPEAAGLYQRALRLKPAWADGWWSLGSILYDLDRHPECVAAFTKFVALKPDVGPAHALLGLCEFGRGNYDAALRSLFRAQELGLPANDPVRQVAVYHTALALILQRNFEKALDVLTPVVAAGPPAPQVRTAAGLAALRMAVLPEKVPASEVAFVNSVGDAMIAELDRKPEEAARLFESLLAAHAQAPHLHYLYGSLLLHSDAARGLAELKAELDVSPDHVPALATLAFEHLKENDAAAALSYAERAARLSPADFAVRTVYGRALLESGRVPDAVRELEAAVKLAPDSPQAHYALANAYARDGREEAAARERKEFSRLQKLLDSGRK